MSVIITSVIILFALIFLGFFAGRGKLIRQESAPDFSSLILQITMPATVFLALIGTDPDGLKRSLEIIPAILLYHIGSILLGVIVVKMRHLPKNHQGVWVYNCTFSNNGFMGLPLAFAVYGNEGLILMALGNAVSNLLLFSVGAKLLTRGHEQAAKIGLRQTLFNNINFAVVAGFIVCLLRIPVPEALESLFTYLGNITSGLSMLVVGLSMSRYRFKGVFTSKHTYAIVVLRLLAVPLLTVLVLKALPIPLSDTAKSILILSAALPSSAAQTMLAEQYHGDIKSTGRAVFMTTLLSLITIPLIMRIGL